MVSLPQLLPFAVTAFVLVAIPGPSVLFVISRSLTLGRTAGLASVLGNAMGVYVQMFAIAVGLGTIVERSVIAFELIKYVGAAYLIYLGVQAIRHRRSLADALSAPVARKRTIRVLIDAFVVGVANPKSVVFFAAILPQFVDSSVGHVSAQMMLLGAVFFVIALVSDGIWALLAGSARAWFTRKPARLQAVGGVGGLAMMGIGVKLALTGRND